MRDNVLVLNKNYLAIQVTSTQKAIILVYKDHAKIINEDWETFDWDAWVLYTEQILDASLSYKILHTPRYPVAAPRVILLTQYDALPRKDTKFSRRNILARDNFRCAYCSQQFLPKDLTYDHILPRSRGGKTTWSNIVAACIPCNSAKRDRTPDEAGMTLKTIPYKPRWKSYVDIPFNSIIEEYWKNFL